LEIFSVAKFVQKSIKVAPGRPFLAVLSIIFKYFLLTKWQRFYIIMFKDKKQETHVKVFSRVLGGYFS